MNCTTAAWGAYERVRTSAAKFPRRKETPNTSLASRSHNKPCIPWTQKLQCRAKSTPPSIGIEEAETEPMMAAAERLLTRATQAFQTMQSTSPTDDMTPADQARIAYMMQVAEDWAVINEMSSQVYEELEQVFFSKNGYLIPDEERDIVNATGGSASYGELESTDQLLRLLDLGPEHTFVDLGSGRGRVALHAALKTRAGRSVGLEMSQVRHRHALEAAARMQARGFYTGDRALLLCEDFMQTDFLDEASHVFMCNTCYTEGLSVEVARRCMNNPNFRVMVTTRELPYQPYLRKIGEYEQEYSWITSGRSYVYARHLNEVPASMLAKLFCDDGVAYLPGNKLYGMETVPLLNENENWMTGSAYKYYEGPLPVKSIQNRRI
mmetsp:Transcript_1534/g.2821  ORF Transcript_1534/g.2821 Transcript_1534/m.2821 type:complete len:380 (+) Transcript_1534:318-1457(+)